MRNGFTAQRGAVFSALLMATTALGGVALPAVAQAQGASVQQRRFDIPAQSLREALLIFSQQSGLQVTTQGPLVEGRTSTAVSGDLPPAEALSWLLTGTGLTFRFDGRDAVRLEPAPQVSDGAIQLGPVRVEGEGSRAGAAASITSDSAATEGTGLYTGSQTTTASRLPLTVRETPQSVTIVTRQRIDDFQMQTMQSVLTSIVGVTEERGESDRSNFVARGFVITNMQVDGIASPFTPITPSPIASPYLDTYLYDRIELVRGATGLLSATGDPSATLNLIRKKPGREFALSGFASVGSRDLYRGGVDLTVPIAANGGVRARLIGLYHTGDSWRVRASDDRLLLSGMLEVDVGPSTLLRIANVWQDTNSRGATHGGLPRYYSDGGRLDMPRSTNLATTWARWDKTENRADITLEQQIGEDWKLVAALGWTRTLSDPRAYFLGRGVPDRAGNGRSFWFFDADGRRDQWTYDAHLNGSFGLFGREHMLMFGVNGYRRRDDRQSGGIAPLNLDGVDTNIFTFTGIVPKPARGARTVFDTAKEKMDGIFGSVRLSLADPLHVIIGGRLTAWRTSQRVENRIAGTATFEETKPGKVFTPFYAATFDIIPELTVYASYADLFTPQSLRDVNNSIIDPIVGSNKEIGLKAALLDERLTINAAIYEAKRDNEARLVVPEFILPNGDSAYRSTGKGNKTRGWEIELSGAVTDRWNLYTGYSQNVTRNPAGQLVNTYTPRKSAKLQTTWKPSVLNDRLTIGGGIVWQNGAHDDIDIDLRVEQGAYALVSLLARFDVTDRLSVAFNANNLFDKSYYTDTSFGYYGEPRSVLFSVNAKF